MGGRLVDWLGQGLLASRPDAADIPALLSNNGGLALWFSHDAGSEQLSLFNELDTTWFDLTTGGGGYTDENAQDALAAAFAAGTHTGLTITYDDVGNAFDFVVTGATLADGDYGDITASSSGTVLTIDNNAVTYAKMQDVSATSRILGRISGGAGDVEELTAANVKTILALVAADISGLGVFATSTDATNLTGTINIARIADGSLTYAKIQDVSATDRLLGRSTAGAGDIEEIPCTAAGRALLDDADAAAQRTTLGLGTAATVNLTVGTVAPGSPAVDDLWVDTN